MRLTLNRHDPGLSCTIGDLLIDGELFSHTLEPRDPIPVGTYKVVLTVSPAAQRGELWSPCGDKTLPELLDVPGHVGIRMHSGNTSLDTKDCVIVGSWLGGEFLSGSRDVLSSFMVKLIDANDAGEAIDIEVCPPESPT